MEKEEKERKMPVQRHVHTYARFKGKPGYYKCHAPNRTHFAQRSLIAGKYSLCNICGTQFQLSFADLDRALPKCLNCSNTKKALLARKAKELTRYLGTDAFSMNQSLPFALESESEEGEELDE